MAGRMRRERAAKPRQVAMDATSTEPCVPSYLSANPLMPVGKHALKRLPLWNGNTARAIANRSLKGK